MYNPCSIASSVSPSGALVAASTQSSGFELYDLEAGKVIRKFKHELAEEDRRLPVSFIHGGHAIIGGSAVGRVNIWFVESGRKLPSIHIQRTQKFLL